MRTRRWTRPSFSYPPPPATPAQLDAATRMGVALYPGIDRFEADRRLRLAREKWR